MRKQVTVVPKADGKAFQAKRFDRPGDITDGLISYLNFTVPRKYGPIDKLTLLVVIGGNHDGQFDAERVSNEFRPEKYPFARIMFMTGTHERIHFGEFWPDKGSKSYSVDEIVSGLPR